jgi:DNA helicase-2/ATP-dependent DNA helicase PcrA
MSGMWIGTFHSLYARMLRMEGERLGYSPSFTIYDQNDQITLIKRVLTDLKLSLQSWPANMIAHRISRAKNSLIYPAAMIKKASNEMEQTLARIYSMYQKRLEESNAMDFDDLLIKPIEIFKRFPPVLEYYQDRFKYILVDEYQDTNHAQYLSLHMLARRHKNICVVGDDDQSIYRWRGADIRNILDFAKDYPKCQKYRLEQNYRSTPNILSTAHSVIRNNTQRHEKQLWTLKTKGEKVNLYQVDDDLSEAKLIVEKIAFEFKKGKKSFGEFAVLYRTNAQSRVIEEAFRTESIPYIIVGGVKFYERKEVKDVLAYLRFLCNPADTISLHRIINYPSRGIGEVTFGRLEAFAQKHNINVFQAMGRIAEIDTIKGNTSLKIKNFYKFIKKYRELKDKLSPSELAASMIDEVGILRHLKEEGTIESLTRVENIRELLLAVAEFSTQQGKKAILEDFLEHVSLTTDIDTWNDRANAVTLMTLHAAKGLEFSVVFIVGIEEGLFPLSRSLSDPLALEEERRLFYVGATRAKDSLYLSWARNRRRFGERASGVRSRFLKEMSLENVNFQSMYSQPFKRQRREVEYDEQQMPDYENESQQPVEFRIGMRVQHPTFGKGTILKIEPSGQNLKMVIMFDDAGKRRVIFPYAKLEIL